MRYLADPSLRRPSPSILLGGSPLRLFRLAGRGTAVVDDLLAGRDVEVDADRAAARLVDRLLDAGAVHPDPAAAPAGAPRADEVTVVVPVRDRPRALDRLLASLADAARRRPDERPAAVVVVDDGSSDAAAHAAVADRYGAELVRRDRSGGPGVARDEGIDCVATPFVAVLDSDCTVDAGWLSPALAQLADTRVAAVAPRVRAAAGDGVLARYEAVRSPLDLGAVPARVAPRTRVAYVPAAGLVLRVAAHEAVGGFDPALPAGEDVDLVWRLADHGWRVRYEPAAVVHHDVRPGWRSWLAQRVAYGASAAALDRRHPGSVAPVSCSAWSAAAWLLAALGHPVVGAALAAGSAAALPRRLGDVPTAEAVRLAVQGHRGAGPLLARAVVRVWWPLALPLALVSRRARRVVALAAVTVVAGARSGAGGDAGLGAARFAALVLADDVAYGAGVWWGCARERNPGPLLADLSGWPRREDRRPLSRPGRTAPGPARTG